MVYLNFAALTMVMGSAVAAVGGGGMRRRLQFTPIVGFTPLTDVRDQLRIDLDQQKIEELLDRQTDESFAQAQQLYEEGAFSKTVSTLTLSANLTVAIPHGTLMVGSTSDTTEATGRSSSAVEVFAYSDHEAGATTIRVQYVNEGCYVGANPDPVTLGCLTPTGTLQVQDDGTTLSYAHDVLADTGNVYSIQLFTDRGEFSFEGNALTRDFQKFVDFYGSESYADDIITAALEGRSTSFSSGKDLDMSGYGLEARAEIAAKASAYMAVWMYVIRELEHAIYLCQTGSCDENSCLGKAPVHEVDEAVAFYAGSLEGSDGSGDGVLTYHLADKRAADFKTGGATGNSLEGTAKANLDVLEVFASMSEHIVNADCDAGREDTTRIVQLMTIPLVQGTLRYAHKMDVQGDTSQKSEAEGVVFAATVLPFVAACNADDADIIYTNMKTGQASTDYAAVKEAFENNYGCMGITAADVGEIQDVSTTVSDNGDSDQDGDSDKDGGLGIDSGALSFSAGIAMVVTAVVSVFSI